ncbi:3-phytase B [Uncinocarpus reesii 1704]|uniref:Phytase A n=1 Tax=Uncinocarpus reesii (strain UAMH 1704) TaxID=336963 RepID=C4JG72_UNCRE|nr:3-phytase B [Uncinocarpus reesii 1704]EEP77621.1 3-phytase B [Uncinocarpus reesii 1704]
MAHAGDRTALLSYQDDEESVGTTPAQVEAPVERNHPTKRQFFSNVSRQVLNRRGLVCNTIELGYQCNQEYAHLWGQYSPYSSLKSKSTISPDVPPGCTITFAQVLSRHGARHPTAAKTKIYAELIDRIQKTSKSYKGDFKFLETFRYPLKSDEMTEFGDTQLFNSGVKFYRRYQNLAKGIKPFIRASGSPRVVKSAEKFIEGFHRSTVLDPEGAGKGTPPVVGVVIPEGPSSNNTLDHSICETFEKDKSGKNMQTIFLKKFAPGTLQRVKSQLPMANITIDDIPYLMDLCSFHTVALTPDASTISPFCRLFSSGEWIDYDYYQSLGKYYHYGPGNTLGREQGIGFTNELIARLTNTPVVDNTNTNRTLNDNPATFPLNATLYADFSHDNTMTSIYAAMGLFNRTNPLPVDRVQTPVQSDGYSAAWTVPFAARAYIEKMKCEWSPRKDDEFVRVLLNDRVFPLYGCSVDALGRCELKDWIKGLSYAVNGGKWESCFARNPAV